MYYVALGDSITAGYGVGVYNSFASIYSRYLQGNRPGLNYANLGVNGLTTTGLMNFLNTARIRQLVSNAQIITITIGSNDLLNEAKKIIQGRINSIPIALYNLTNNYGFIFQELRSLCPLAEIKIADIYNPLTQGPYANFSKQAQNIIYAVNNCIYEQSKRFGIQTIPVDKVFRGREALLLGPDHIHPNITGHQVIAAQFARR